MVTIATRPRVRRLLIALLAGLAVGFVVLLTTSNGLTTIRGGRIGGDLPAFYGAGRILRSGNARALYDPATEEAAQRDLLPPDTPGRLPFPYPPFVALAYVPLAALPFKVAYVIHVLVMAACVVGAVAILCRLLPALRGEFLPVLGATLVFYPVFRAVLGGQNTALSLLLAAGATSAMARRRDLAAGLWTGVWMYKPQLAVPVAGVLLLRSTNRVRFAIGVAAVGIPYYLAGIALGGWDWPIWWWRDGAVPFAVADLIVDRGNGISFAELASEYGLVPLNWFADLVVVAAAVWTARRPRLHPLGVVAVAAGTAILISPHTLFYDGGLAALGLIAAGALRPSLFPAVGAIWLLAWAQPLRAYLPIPPMTIVVILSMWLAARAEGVGAPEQQ
jgi:hypothetical protein